MTGEDDNKLRNNIRKQLIVYRADLILQLQLALLQPRQLQLVRRAAQGIDGSVEVAMILRELGEFRP